MTAECPGLACCLHASDFCYIYTIQPVRSSTYSRSNRQDHGGIKSFLRESKATHLPPRHFYVLGPFSQTEPFAGLPPSLLYSSYLPGRIWSLLKTPTRPLFCG